MNVPTIKINAGGMAYSIWGERGVIYIGTVREEPAEKWYLNKPWILQKSLHSKESVYKYPEVGKPGMCEK